MYFLLRQVTDVGVAALGAALTGLQELGLDGTRVGAAALEALAGLPRLRKLSLLWCRAVTDAGARVGRKGEASPSVAAVLM